jgi:pimeloyl-ACP methyl ester carboxylesterase
MDIVLIPGFMLDADLWTDVRPDLARLGRLHDADMTQDSSIAGMAACSGRHARPAIIVGFSMGGYVAREILYQAPDKVAALALIATSSQADTADRTAQRMSAAAGNRAFRRLSRGGIISSLHPDHRNDTLIGRVQDMSERLGGAVLAASRRSGARAILRGSATSVAPPPSSPPRRTNCAALRKAKRCMPGSGVRP